MVGPSLFVGRRIRDKRSRVEFVVEAEARVVVHGVTRIVLYGACGERSFATDAEVIEHDPLKTANEKQNLEFASIIWQCEVNIPKPLMRAEAERRIAGHLDAFRLVVETERDLYVGRAYEERIEKLQQEISELKRANPA